MTASANKHYAPSFNEALTNKRIRRQFEPETKSWNDAALDTVWDDVPGITKHTVFAMKNIFFFSHATEVQAKSIPVFTQPGTSAVVEAATGSGKTIAFLVPLLERVCQHVSNHVGANGRPFLDRKIVGVVISPSRVLAEQTYIVAKSLACRFPFNIRVALCDGIVEKAPRVVAHLRRVPRGAGTILVTTPLDLIEFLEEMMKPPESGAAVEDAEEAEEAEEEVGADSVKGEEEVQQQQRDATPTIDPADDISFGGLDASSPFCLVVDEADVVMRSTLLRHALDAFLSAAFVPQLDERLEAINAARAASATPSSTPMSPAASAKKGRKAPATTSTAATPAEQEEVAKLPMIDFGFYGATVGSSKVIAALVAASGAPPQSEAAAPAAPAPLPGRFAAAPETSEQGSFDFSDGVVRLLKHNRTAFTPVVLHDDTDFVSQLANRYVSCPLNTLIASLIHIIDVHPSKKHFIFFNSPATLLFMHKLLTELSRATRPLVHIDKVYILHEDMKEEVKFEQYNGFLSHKPEQFEKTIKKTIAEKDELEAQRSVHPSHNHKLGRAKRSVAPPKATGAILLCTDIAAYGLDIRDVDYCYHFEPPQTVQSYVHRIGRVGRMGMRGSSLLLLPSHLAQEDGEYFQMLKSACSLQLYKPPPAAPITSTLRGFVTNACQKEARRAAMAFGGPNQTLFTPKQAMQALLLMD